MVRTAAVTVLVTAVLAAGAPAAPAQSPESVSRAAADLPTTLFEAPPEGIPRPAGVELEDPASGVPLLVAFALFAAAALVGYGSSRRTRRS